MTPRCPKGHIIQQEHDGVSAYLLCRTCGWLQNLNRDGTPYVPPTKVTEEDLPTGAWHHFGWQPNASHANRRYRDGCQVHDHCLTCPLPDCLVNEPWKRNQVV